MRAPRDSGLGHVDTDLRVTKRSSLVTLDRDRAEDLGVPARDIANGPLTDVMGGRDLWTDSPR